jgi:UDP-glucose 4-epimerase
MVNKILITGGLGFIGTNLVSYLTKLNHEIVVLDDESLGKRNHVQETIQFFKGDICDRSLVEKALEGVDAVVHLAAHTRVVESTQCPDYNFEVNVKGSFTLLSAMRDAGIKRLISASTGGAILGEVEPPVHEEMMPCPVSPYGASKLAVEGYCSAFNGSYGMQAASLRFSNVYGPRSFHKGSVVAAFYKQILAGKPLMVYGDGSQVRDFIFVEDLCQGIEQALQKPEATGVFQLGTGIPTSVNTLIENMRHVIGDTHPIDVVYEDFRSGELRATYCDISKARRELDFNPSTSLKEGLKPTWDWFLMQ